MITLAIDLAVIGTIAFCGWRGYVNGLIRGVFGIVALIVSIFVANVVAEAYSEEFTDMLQPFVGGIIDSAFTEMDKEGIEYDAEEHEHENDTEEFGRAYMALRHIGLPEESAVRIAEMVAQEDLKGYLSDVFSDVIADKLSSVLAYVAVFAIAFILVAIIFTVIGNLVGFVFSLPGLKLLDSLSGAAFGLAKGYILVCTLATVVKYFGLIAPDTIAGTSALSYFIINNPIADMLGL